MSDIKVSEMAEATEINNDDLLMIVQNDVSKKAKVKNVNKQIYSTEEVKIGTWIDGKTLYKKTIEFDINASGQIIKNHNISNMDICVDVECIFKRMHSDNTSDYYYYSRTSEDNIRAGIDCITQTTITFYIDSAFNTSVKKGYVTLKYTKTN